MHVVDISHHNFEEHFRTVKQTLNEIGAGDKPVIVVFNKIDAYRPEPHDPHDLAPKRPEQFSSRSSSAAGWRMDNEECIFISRGRTHEHRPAAEAAL